MTSLRIGRHVQIANGLENLPLYANNIGYDIIQIFLGAPQRITNKPRKQAELISLGKKLKKYDIKLVIHGSYTINLCHPLSNTKFDASLKSLVQDLEAASIIGDNCLGVIIHMGKNIPQNNIDDDEAIENYVAGLKKALATTPENSTIILETGASQGSEVGSDIEGLSEIYWSLKKSERNRVYFCIDTCHIWATGYDVSDKTGVKGFFEQFDDEIGIDKIICIHFNDSKTDLQSCVDRHADLGYGKIKEQGLKEIAIFSKKYNIPLIMETPLSAVNKKTNQEISLEDELALVKKWTK